jgi:hypothetical protein
VNNETILKGSDISRSTWAVEQNRLIDFGLLEKKNSRLISKNNVFRTVNYRLTEKGRTITLNLLEISRILDSGEKPTCGKLELSQSIDSLLNNPDSELSSRIRESIEIALEGYGINFLNDVKSAMENERRVQWNQVPGRIDLLTQVLVEFFGAEGAKTVESLICANIKSRFGLSKLERNDLQSLILEAASSFRSEIRDQEIISEDNAPILARKNISDKMI